MNTQTPRADVGFAVFTRHLAVVDGSSLDEKSGPVALSLKEQRVGTNLTVKSTAFHEKAILLPHKTKITK